MPSKDTPTTQPPEDENVQQPEPETTGAEESQDKK